MHPLTRSVSLDTLTRSCSLCFRCYFCYKWVRVAHSVVFWVSKWDRKIYRQKSMFSACLQIITTVGIRTLVIFRLKLNFLLCSPNCLLENALMKAGHFWRTRHETIRIHQEIDCIWNRHVNVYVHYYCTSRLMWLYAETTTGFLKTVKPTKTLRVSSTEFRVRSGTDCVPEASYAMQAFTYLSPVLRSTELTDHTTS